MGPIVIDLQCKLQIGSVIAGHFFFFFLFSSSYLDFRVVLDGRGAVSLVGQKDLVHSIFVLFHGMTCGVPLIY